MTARTTSRKSASSNVHHLRRGAEYRATTHNLIAIGEYLGMETPHGDRAILIRNSSGHRVHRSRGVDLDPTHRLTTHH